MRDVDEKMGKCCLKHEIRSALWERYSRAVLGGRRPMKYLTLYSPHMMDIKYFEQSGLIRFENGKYVGVAAVTNDEEAYAAAIEGGAGRPEFLAPIDLNRLLVRPFQYRQFSRRFHDMFPFDVMNLDYCNSLFCNGNEHDVSLHVEAIDKAIELQQRTGARRFALLLTTRAEPGQVADHFLKDLEGRIDSNRARNSDFRGRYEALYDRLDGASLRDSRYEDFVSLGLVKFVGNLISAHGFELLDCEAANLVRDGRTPTRWILHTAFSIARPRRTLTSLGRPDYLERNVVRHLERRDNGTLIRLTERNDLARLQAKHTAAVSGLARLGFEVRVPEPEA